MKKQETDYHSLTIKETYEKYETSQDGLSDAEALARLQRNGKNILRQKPKKTIWQMLIEQLSDVMVMILIAAAALSVVLNEWTEAIVILIIIAVDAIIGIVQEKKAMDAMEALKNMSAPMAVCLREGEKSHIPAEDLVVGDYVFIEAGSIVPADLRLIESHQLQIQEASLTGESVPVHKDADLICEKQTTLGDRLNMAYTSSIVTNGTGEGVVVATGMDTEVGHIAHLLDDQDELDTPLKRKLNSVGKTLSVVGIFVCVLMFIIGYLYHKPLVPLLMTAISLAISIIPEGLPATATIVMALGVQRMAKQHALVRQLPAVETLGSASVICCDKTGTLTQNKMTVTHLSIGLKPYERQEDVNINDAGFIHLLQAGMLCNNASLDPDHIGEILGDPTEGALLNLGVSYHLDPEEIEEKYPRVYEQAFDSDRKRMSTVHQMNGRWIVYTKGAVDSLLPLCNKRLEGKQVVEMTEKDRLYVLEQSEAMSGQALRVLGYAMRYLDKVPEEDDVDVEHDLIYLGMSGMIDPPRTEVIEAIETCHQAGIRVVMITGDHQSTALAIGKQLHLYQEGNRAVSGSELDRMSDEELDKIVRDVTIFARVSPSDKLRIIQSLKRVGEIAAMTGDGVNDSPALKAADIGIAMGQTGTDVAKDSADMILMDDNFTTIEFAIREGRRVYRNIQKVIQFLLAGNIAEIMTLFIATILNWEAPILAVHVLLINLATDTLPALALGVDPASKNIMRHQPVKSNSLFEKGLVERVIVHGLFITLATIIAYWYGLYTDEYAAGMTMAFCVLAISQLFHALNQRSNTESVFTAGNGHNPWLFLAMLASAMVLVVVLAVPAVRAFFSLSLLTASQWGIVAMLSLLPLVFVEISKLIQRILAK